MIIYRDPKRWAKYLALFTDDPEGDSCFSIYQIMDKNEKVTFVNQKRHLVGTLFTTAFVNFVNCIFTILLQILNENKFYLPVNTDKPKFVGFFVICLYDWFIFRSNFVFRKRLETPRRHLGSGRKTVNSQGYSELRKPIKKSENCYSLIW